MKILMRNHKNEKWQLVQSAAYANETELQKLLHQQPSLISVDEAREGAGVLVAAVREFPLEIGSVDLVGFTADGDIAVIECKLANNEEIKRKVIGQVLEYGANLWGMSYEELDQKIQQRSSKSLADLVRDAVEDPDWEEESFRGNIEHALQAGTFILIIVVDEINEGLSRIVRFINDAGKPAFALAALEMRRFQKDQAEILVPHLFGAIGTGNPPHPSRKQWTEQRFMETASDSISKGVYDIICDLYQWSKTKAYKVWLGTGTVTGSFTFHYQRNGKPVSVFTVYTDGRLVINLGYLATPVEAPAIAKFQECLKSIPGFQHIPAEINKWPSVKIEEMFLNKPEVLAQFKKAVEEFDRYI